VPISSEEYEEQQQATMDVRHKLELQTVCAMICSEKKKCKKEKNTIYPVTSTHALL